MQAIRGTLLLITTLNIANAQFNIYSIFDGSEVSIGSYTSYVSLGNLTKKYPVLEPNDVKAAGNAAEFLELLRRMFAVGVLELPPLDPFNSSNLEPLVFGPGFISGKVYLDSLKVTGAEHFELELLETRLKTGRVDFDVVLPKIDLIAEFRTDLYVGDFIPLAFRGEMRGKVFNIRLAGALQTEVRQRNGQEPSEVYQITGLAVNTHAHDVKVAFKGIYLDLDLLQSTYADDDDGAFSHLTLPLGDIVSEYVANNFISFANGVLNNISAAQIDAYLLPEEEIKGI